jgi:threonine dehydratase
VTSRSPTLDDIISARRAIESIARCTPIVLSELSPNKETPLWLKLEITQPTGSFKIRGAANAISKLTEEQKQCGVACCSTGNHGRALAYAAGEASVDATVCLSSLVPENKVQAIERLGARVKRVGESQDDAQREVDRLVADQGVTEIPPFDHFDVVSGQGTIALEILDEHPEIETLLVPMSGGGLISGIAIAAKAVKPEIRIVGISMDRGAAMAASLDAGKPVEVREVASLADSLGGGIGLRNQHTFDICRDLVDEVILLTESEIYNGMRALFYEDRFVAEGAAAVGHAAVVTKKIELTGPTAIVLSGRNVDTRQFADVVAGNPIQLNDVVVTGD